MQKREFFQKLTKDLRLKDETMQIAQNTDYYNNVIKLTIFRPYTKLATYSESKIVIFCDKNLVTVKQYKQGKEIFHHASNYSYNQQNMVQLTADIIVNLLKKEGN